MKGASQRMSEQEKQMIEILGRQISIEGMDIEDVKKTDLISLGLSSLEFMKYLIKLEETFNIEINDYEELSENITLNDLYSYLLEKDYFLAVKTSDN